VDASPATEKALTEELEKLARVYGATGGGGDFTKFPTFTFTGNCSYISFTISECKVPLLNVAESSAN